MGILKKFNEFKEQGGEEIFNKIETPISNELKQTLDELKERHAKGQGAEVTYNGFKISLPSELNGEGQSELTYLIIGEEGNGKHAQSQSEKEIDDYIQGKILHESLKYKNRSK